MNPIRLSLNIKVSLNSVKKKFIDCVNHFDILAQLTLSYSGYSNRFLKWYLTNCKQKFSFNGDWSQVVGKIWC